MNRSEHWQNLAFGRVLLTPGSVLTLTLFYHFRQNSQQELCVRSNQMVLVLEVIESQVVIGDPLMAIWGRFRGGL
jgi:hypothetical protein